MKMLKVVLRESDKISEKVIDSFTTDKANKEFDIQDGVIIGLFENIIAKTKSLIHLLDSQNYDASDLIARAIFESHVYLKFILEENEIQRAKAYAYGSKISDYKLLDRILEESKVGRELRDFLGKTEEEIKKDHSNAMDDQERDRVTSEYLALLNAKKTKTNWYDFDGKTTSFEILCGKMGMMKEYELLYRIFSKDVHSNRALARIKASENEIQIGNFDVDPKLHISLVALFLMESARSVLGYYKLKNDLRSFNAMLQVNQKFK